MKILIIRHAIAMERDAFARFGRPDSERPLTKEGEAKMRKAAKGLKSVLENSPLICSSPWTRAVQTADILANAFKKKKIHVHPLFRPGGDYASRLKMLASFEKPLVVLTGHEPDLGHFISWMMTGNKRGSFQLKKGGAVLIDFIGRPKGGHGNLLWALPPKILRLLGK